MSGQMWRLQETFKSYAVMSSKLCATLEPLGLQATVIPWKHYDSRNLEATLKCCSMRGSESLWRPHSNPTWYYSYKCNRFMNSKAIQTGKDKYYEFPFKIFFVGNYLKCKMHVSGGIFLFLWNTGQRAQYRGPWPPLKRSQNNTACCVV